MKHRSPHRHAPRPNQLVRALAACSLLTLWPGAAELRAQVLPSGMNTVAGQVSARTVGGTLTVNNSPNAIINWNSFSIGAGNAVRFEQANATSQVLNRVVGNDPSSILGSLSSNGRVWLLNPNGVLFGQGARVDVAGLVTSTLNLSNADWLAGNYRFAQGVGNPAGIVNQGELRSSMGGHVMLIGATVRNEGEINAPGGQVVLAAGSSVELVDSGAPNVSVKLNASAGEVLNLGRLMAAGGRIDVHGATVNQNGIVRADSLSAGPGGEIVLQAMDRLTLAGTSETSATSDSGRGGQIKLLGREVGLLDTARVDASGGNGGGQVLVGGGLQGKDASVPNAQAVYFAPAATIVADATVSGDGGRVILWSDIATRAFGSLSVRGGPLGGNGGFIETSGGWLDVRPARLDTSAPLGRSGSWLLDPFDITVSDSLSTTAGVDANFTAVNDSATIRWSDLSTALAAGTQVTVSTGAAGNTGTQAGNISIIVFSSPAVNAGAGSSLTFIADGSIDISGTLAFGGASMPLTFLAGRSGQGVIQTPSTSTTITLANGDITFGGFTTYNRAGGGTFQGATGYDASHPTGVDLTRASIDALGGTITLNGGSRFQGAGSGVNIFDSNLLARNILVNGNTADFGTSGAGITTSAATMEARQTMDLRGMGTFQGIVIGQESQLILTNSFPSSSLRLFGVGQQDDGVLLDGSETPFSLVFDKTGGSVAIDGTTAGSESTAVRIIGPGTSANVIDVSGGTTLTIGGVATSTSLSNARVSANPLDANGAPFTLHGSETLTLDNSQITSGGPITVHADSMFFGLGTTITSHFVGPTGIVLQGAGNGPIQAFDNFAGATALQVGTGSRWLVFATDPAGFDAGGLAYDFKRYNALPGDAAIAGDVGNGLAFSVPQFAALTGAVQTKTYDGTTAATVTNLAVTGGVNQDQPVGSPSISGAVFGSPNAGSNNNVTLNGVSLQFVDVNQKPVYGYTAQYLLRGTINPAPVTVAVTGMDKVYDATTLANPFATVTSGLVGTETLVVNSFAQFPTKDVGAYPVSVDIALANGTNGGLASNYSVAPILNVSASIAPATLRYVAAPVSQPIGLPLPLLTGTVADFVGGETLQTATTGTLQFTTLASSPPSLPGSYAVIGGGLSATNYSFVQDPTNNTALTLTLGLSPEQIVVSREVEASPKLALELMARPAPPVDSSLGGVVDLVPGVSPTAPGARPAGPAAAPSFEPVSLSDMSGQALADMLDARAQYKRTLFADAVAALEKNPALADMPPCRSRDELRSGACVLTDALKRQMKSTPAPASVASTPVPSSSAAPSAATGPAAPAATAAAAPVVAAATPSAPLLAGGARRVRNASLPQINRKVAVVIGVDEYQDPTIPKLANAVSDAHAIGKVLESQMGYETVVLENATKKAVVIALNQLAVELGPKDSVVLYYAGHGELVESTKLGYWQLADSDPKRPETWMSNADIARMVAHIEASQVALISDSCYSGSLVTDQRIRAAVGTVDPAQMLARKSVVVMSSGGNEPVADAGKQGHSPFAWNLMNNLRQLSTWQPGGNVFERVRFAVAKELPQRPQYGAFTAAGHEGGGDYLFEQRQLEPGTE